MGTPMVLDDVSAAPVGMESVSSAASSVPDAGGHESGFWMIVASVAESAGQPVLRQSALLSCGWRKLSPWRFVPPSLRGSA